MGNLIKTGFLLAGPDLPARARRRGARRPAGHDHGLRAGHRHEPRLLLVLRQDRAARCTGPSRSTKRRRPRSTASSASWPPGRSIPMPQIYIIQDDSPNAFATGRNPAARRGRRHRRHPAHHERGRAGGRARPRALPRAEPRHADHGHRGHPGRRHHLHGAHGPVGGDLRRRPARQRRGGRRAAALIGMLLMAVLAPLAAMLIQMAISRSREYQADATGARLAGRPPGSSSAREARRGLEADADGSATPATAHLFIVNPLTGGGSPRCSRRIRRSRSAWRGCAP